MKVTAEIKLFAIFLILGIPLLGLLLLERGLSGADNIMSLIGIIMILALPVIMTVGIMRTKSIKK
jgi:hypothetical protein